MWCFAVGSAGVSPSQKDIGFTSISPDPSPAAVKADIKVKGKVNAPGFLGRKTKIRLRINDVEIKTEEFELSKEFDNEIEITTKAPDTPGEVKVSLELVNPPENQSTTLNDKIETYLTVTREGVRVLVIGKLQRLWAFAGAGFRQAPTTGNIRSSEAEGNPRREGLTTSQPALRRDHPRRRSPKMLTPVRPQILRRSATSSSKGHRAHHDRRGTFGGTAGVPRDWLEGHSIATSSP